MQLHASILLVAAVIAVVSASPYPAPGFTVETNTSVGPVASNNDHNYHCSSQDRKIHRSKGNNNDGIVNNPQFNGNVHNTGNGNMVGDITGSFTGSVDGFKYTPYSNGTTTITGEIRKNGYGEADDHNNKIRLKCDKDGIISGKINDIDIGKIVGDRDGSIDIIIDHEGVINGTINGGKISNVNSKIPDIGQSMSDKTAPTEDSPVNHAKDGTNQADGTSTGAAHARSGFGSFELLSLLGFAMIFIHL